jgi:hypothetical protein
MNFFGIYSYAMKGASHNLHDIYYTVCLNSLYLLFIRLGKELYVYSKVIAIMIRVVS